MAIASRCAFAAIAAARRGKICGQYAVSVRCKSNLETHLSDPESELIACLQNSRSWESLKNKTLEKLLVARKLKKSGTKAELIKRLQDALQTSTDILLSPIPSETSVNEKVEKADATDVVDSKEKPSTAHEAQLIECVKGDRSWSSMTVETLKHLLRSRKERVGGKKEELIARLQALQGAPDVSPTPNESQLLSGVRQKQIASDPKCIDKVGEHLSDQRIGSLFADTTSTQDQIALQRFVTSITKYSMVLPVRGGGKALTVVHAMLPMVSQYLQAVAAALTKPDREKRRVAEEKAGRRLVKRVDQLLAGRRLDETKRLELATELVRCCSCHEMLHDALHQVTLDDTRHGEGADQIHNSRSFFDLDPQINMQSASKEHEAWTMSPDASLRCLVGGRKVLEAQVALDGTSFVEGSSTNMTLRSLQSMNARGTNGLPMEETTILLSNLPRDVTEEQIHAALEPCGIVRSIEICSEWVDTETEQMAMMSTNLSMHEKVVLSRQFRPEYAIVEFDSVEARLRATRRPLALFGILFKEQMPTSAKIAFKTVGRSAYPQDASLKRTLLLENVPWTCSPWEVMQACAQRLGNTCALRLVNSGIFSVDRKPIDSFVVKANTEPVHGLMGHIGAVVLRFSCFTEARLAKSMLQGLIMDELPVKCGFSPHRLKVCEVDSCGYPLPEPILVDVPLPPSSARYDNRAWDPVLHGPTACPGLEDLERTCQWE